MLATNSVVVLAAEAAHLIPGSDWRAKVAVPLGIIIFLGSVYMLVRANLGTRRGYLVTATSLFGFMIIYSLFWAFGAPGTPPATGPQNLPGQELDAYEDTWRPFAGDSLIADDPTYAVAKTYPEGFSDTPQDADLPAELKDSSQTGSDDIKSFFSTSQALKTKPIGETWAEVKSERKYAKAANGRPIIAATFQQTYQVAQVDPLDPPAEGDEPVLTADGAKVAEDESNVAPPDAKLGDVVENGESYTAFAYFDAGSPLFPSLVVLGIVLILFAIHALLLAMDERRERREREAVAAEAATARARTPEPAGRP